MRQSVCWPRSQWVSLALFEPLAQEARVKRKSTEGVKLTSPLENKIIQSRFTVLLPTHFYCYSNLPKCILISRPQMWYRLDMTFSFYSLIVSTRTHHAKSKWHISRVEFRDLWLRYMSALQYWNLSIKTTAWSFCDNIIEEALGRTPHRVFSVQTGDRRVLVVCLWASRSKRRTPGQKPPSWEPRHQRHVVFSQIWSSGNGLAEYSEGGEQRIFCYLTVLLGEKDHNSGRRGEQQTAYIFSPATRTRARLICVNGCVLRPSLEGIKDIFINFLYI